MWNRDGYWGSLLVIACAIARDSLVKAEPPVEVAWPPEFGPDPIQTINVSTSFPNDGRLPQLGILTGQRVDSADSQILQLINSTTIEIVCPSPREGTRDKCSGTISIDIPREPTNLFFCVAISEGSNVVCSPGSISPAFNVAGQTPSSESSIANQPISFDTTATFLSGFTATLTLSPTTQSSIAPTPTGGTLASISSGLARTSVSPQTSLTTTESPAIISALPTADLISTVDSGRNTGGLSKNDRLALILSLVIGGLLIIGLALFFFLRRRKTMRRNALGSGNGSSQPEHMMLTQNSQAEHDNDHDQEQDMSQIVNQATIRSKDGISTATTVSERGIVAGVHSRSSTIHDTISRSDTETQTDSREISSPTSFTHPYRDHEDGSDVQPIYGDTRRTPQIFSSPCPPENRDSSAPPSRHFLDEEGMSREDIERLEEEERRIDAAIAEAESRDMRRGS